MRRKRQASAPPKPKISTQAAKERLAPAAPWFKPKQPEVYWDVDVAKIQRAREAVEEARKKKKDYDFEITDMPIKALRKKARLGAAGEEEPEVKENEVEELGTTKSEELLRNATIHNVDDMFSDQVDSWTTIAMESFHNATRRARQSIAKISRQAIRAEESLLMNKMDVRMYVDFADPYSLELVLGAYQKLSSMRLGPVDWNIVPFVNVGQFHNSSVNCMYSDHGRHLSCTTNAIAACAVDNVGALRGGMQAFTSCYGMQLLKLGARRVQVRSSRRHAPQGRRSLLPSRRRRGEQSNVTRGRGTRRRPHCDYQKEYKIQDVRDAKGVRLQRRRLRIVKEERRRARKDASASQMDTLDHHRW